MVDGTRGGRSSRDHCRRRRAKEASEQPLHHVHPGSRRGPKTPFNAKARSRHPLSPSRHASPALTWHNHGSAPYHSATQIIRQGRTNAALLFISHPSFTSYSAQCESPVPFNPSNLRPLLPPPPLSQRRIPIPTPLAPAGGPSPGVACARSRATSPVWNAAVLAASSCGGARSVWVDEGTLVHSYTEGNSCFCYSRPRLRLRLETGIAVGRSLADTQ